MNPRSRKPAFTEYVDPDYPENKGAAAQYMRGEATAEAYAFARRRWLAWTWDKPRPQRKAYQHELAWWRGHCKKAREA